MKRVFAIFVLTPAEQRVVIFVVVALLAWTWAKYQRPPNVDTSPPPNSATPHEREL